MTEQIHHPLEWPYPIKWGEERTVVTDVLILGGGIAGCWAAISAAKKGVKVALVEKGAVIRSGAGGSGCDHWESAATNPCSKVTPEELTQATHALSKHMYEAAQAAPEAAGDASPQEAPATESADEDVIDAEFEKKE